MSDQSNLPPCGIYKTLAPMGEVPSGRLVYFHNHGNPGPGVYFPESWSNNRARFSERGTLLPSGFDPRALMPLPGEGLYRVTNEFYCCSRNCVKYDPETLVQLGYNGAGDALLFLPELTSTGMNMPTRGTRIDDAALASLAPLRVMEVTDPTANPMMH